LNSRKHHFRHFRTLPSNRVGLLNISIDTAMAVLNTTYKIIIIKCIISAICKTNKNRIAKLTSLYSIVCQIVAGAKLEDCNFVSI
jgi:hypothetical protein